MAETRIIIAGPRDFFNYDFISEKAFSVINKLNISKDEIRIISGHAEGVDKSGERFAEVNKYKLSIFPAEWGIYGNTAGFIRNGRMARFAIENGSQGILIAFINGSKGTKNMLEQARKYNLKTYIFKI